MPHYGPGERLPAAACGRRADFAQKPAPAFAATPFRIGRWHAQLGAHVADLRRAGHRHTAFTAQSRRAFAEMPSLGSLLPGAGAGLGARGCRHKAPETPSELTQDDDGARRRCCCRRCRDDFGAADRRHAHSPTALAPRCRAASRLMDILFFALAIQRNAMKAAGARAAQKCRLDRLITTWRYCGAKQHDRRTPAIHASASRCRAARSAGDSARYAPVLSALDAAEKAGAIGFLAGHARARCARPRYARTPARMGNSSPRRARRGDYRVSRQCSQFRPRASSQLGYIFAATIHTSLA